MPYDFGLVQTIDGLGHGIVIRISDAADGGVNTCLRQTFRIANRQILGGFNRSLQQWVVE